MTLNKLLMVVRSLSSSPKVKILPRMCLMSKNPPTSTNNKRTPERVIFRPFSLVSSVFCLNYSLSYFNVKRFLWLEIGHFD